MEVMEGVEVSSLAAAHMVEGPTMNAAQMVEGCTMDAARLSKSLHQLKVENVLTDITIICHGKVIAAHKCVLAAGSQFFKTLFCQDTTYMCRCFQSCDFTDQLEPSAADFLELIVDFMYCQTIVLNDINVADVAKLAFFFVIDDLLETCYQFINSVVSLKNALDLHSRLNKVAEFRAGPIYLQSLDKSIDLLKVPFQVIQGQFHDLLIQSDVLVRAKAEDLVDLMSRGVAKACTIDSVVWFVIRWLQRHPKDDGFEVASLLLDFALEKSRVPMRGTISSWVSVPNLYQKVESVLYGSSMSQAYQTGLLTKMSAIMEQLESHDYHVIKEQELMAAKPEKERGDKTETEVKTGTGDETMTGDKTNETSDTGVEIVADGEIKSDKESKDKQSQTKSNKNGKDGKKSYSLRKKKTKGDALKYVLCKICKLEFKEKYQLTKHVKRVHSKPGKVSVKIRTSKSKLKSKSGKGSKQKSAGSKKVKEEVKTEKMVLGSDLKDVGVSSHTAEIKGEKLAHAGKEIGSGDANVNHIVDNIELENVNNVEEDHNYFTGLRKTSNVIYSDLDDDNPDSDSTIENEPIDMNDQANNLIHIDNQIDSDILHSMIGDFMQFQCSECRQIFDSEKDLNQHLLKHPEKRKAMLFKCKNCRKKFKYAITLRRHKCEKDEGRTFECFVCKDVFPQMRELRKHLKSHTENRPFSCDMCQLVYKGERDFIRHSMLHSQADRLFKCHVCDKQFTRKYHLTRHTLIHQGKIPRKHKCPHCNESFSRTTALQRHLPLHNGEPGIEVMYETPIKSHPCEVCGYVFHDVNNLIRHIRVHTGEKPFGCEICGKAFSQKGQLNIHKLTHGGARQYQCEMCPKLFLTNSGLHKHRRQVHSNYRPYKCDYCSKEFLQKSDLRRHVPMHTGEKNFQCDICAICFARKDKLVSHFKQEHMQELK